MSIADLVVRLRLEAEQLKSGLQGVRDKLQNLGSSMVAAGGALTQGITAPIVAGVALISNLTNEAIGYERQMKEVFTLMPGMTKEAMGSMSDDLLAFAKDMGIIPEEAVPALYQAISAGVPSDNVFAFLETAQKAAVGGVTDLTTAVDGITTVVNSYGADVMDATTASDLMFTAVRLGKTTFDELSKSLFNTLPTASALGVSFGDVTAALASMTAQGVPTSVATTQMRQLLVELSKEGGTAAKTFEQLSGQSFKDFIAEGGNVAEALNVMHGHAENMGVGINDLFSSVEAGNAALALSGENMAGYVGNINEMNNAAGATEAAFQVMEESVGRQMEKLKAEFAAAKIEIGDKFLPIIVDTLIPIFRDQVMPVIEKVAGFVANLAEKFSELDPTTQTVILGAIALLAALGPVLIVAGMMVTAIGALVPVFGFLLSPVGLIIAAIVALVAIFVYLWNTNEAFRDGVIAIWEGIKTVAMAVFGALQAFWDNWGSTIVAVFSAAWDQIKNIFTTVVTIITNIFKLFTAVLKGDWSGAWEAIKAIGTAAWTFLKNSITNLRTALSAIWQGIYDRAKQIWDNIKTAVTQKVTEVRTTIETKLNEAWNYIKGIPAQAIGWGRNIIDGLIQGITNAASRVWAAVKNIIQRYITDPIKDFFGISSPSKLFMGFGENMAQGLAIGMDSAKGLIAGASISMAGASVTGMSSGGMNTGGSRSSGTVNFDLNGLFSGAHITIGSERDAKSMAREIFRLADARARSEGVMI